MAEAVVSCAVERIGNLLIEEAKFLHGVRDQVLELQTELLRMQCFLEDADAVRYKDKRVSNWVSEIREFAYSAENVLSTFIYEVESKRRIRGVRRLECLLNKGIALHKVGSEMETLKIKITNLTARLQTYGIRNLTSAPHEASEKRLLLRRTYSHVVEEDFIGFEDVISDMVAKMVDKARKSRTVSICGMGGLGKTTLAKKIYHHVSVRRHFEAFAWACISQQWKKEDVLQGILINLAPEKMKEIEKMENKDQQLVKQLFQVQKEKKCLVVLDDVWSTDVWDIIGPAFPSESKILITSRNKDVAAYIDPSGFVHQPDLLDEKESLELFQRKALLRGEDSDSTIKEKVKLGKEMVKHCRGLPLAIVVLGGLLARKYTLNEWQIVHQHIDSYLGRNKSCREHGVGISEVLALSYHDLPYWLKPCFLYLGNFPEDYVIEAKTLYQLWIAEGFISLEEGIRRNEETAMEVAERYLSELAQRCMVQVQIKDDYHTRSGKRFKSCGLHDLMRDMCLSMVKEENFSKMVDCGLSNDQQICLSSSFFATSSIHNCKIHRLAIHWINDTNLDLPSYQEKDIRSVLFFHGEKCTYKFCQKMLSRIMKDFKLVRVLDLQGFYRYGISLSLPKTMGNLVHLRYLSLKNANFFKLPSSVGNLRYLETLDLRSAFEPIVPNVLWKLERLRHLYLHRRIHPVRNGKLRLDGLNNLETLHNFDSSRCNVEHLPKLNNLRSLTNARICYNLKDLEVFIRYLTSITQKPLVLLRHSTACVGAIIARERGDWLDGINFCTKEGQILLRQMFFECHELHKLQLCGRICELPEYQQGSNSSLTHLTLGHCKLDEDPLPRLGKLPNLIRLYLLTDSFLGKKMVCSTQSFPLLKSLKLCDLPNLEEWRVDEGALPSLSFLQIEHCTELKMVPDGLRCITTLQELSIHRMSRTLVNRILLPDGTEGEDFDKVRHIPYIKFSQIY